VGDVHLKAFCLTYKVCGFLASNFVNFLTKEIGMRVRKVLSLMVMGLFIISAFALDLGAKELKIANTDDISTFDPGFMNSGERELTIMRCIFNGLAKYKEGSWEVVPDLAESWTVSEDNLEVTFKLRKGVNFQKGYGEMTAEDVKFSYERLIAADSTASEKRSWKQLDHVEIIDTYTVKLVFKEPKADLFTSVLPNNSSMVISKKAFQEMGQEKFAFNPIGTGPYELAVWEPKKRIQLKAFKKFWGKAPKIDTITFLPITEETTCEIALRTGELNVSRVTPLNIPRFKKDSKFSVSLSPDMRIYWLGMTMNKPPFDKLKVRQALRYALDVDKIIEAAYYGVADRATTILPPGVPGRYEDAPVYKQDFKKAKQLLKEAGLTDGFTMSLNGPSFEPQRIMAEVIKADAAKVGINVDIQLKEQAAANSIANKGEAHAYFTSYTCTVDPAYVMQWFVPGTGWNPSQWDNQTYVNLLAEGGKELKQDKRTGYYIDAQKEMDKDCWAIWLTHGFKVWVAGESVDMGKIYPNGMLAPWTMSFK